MNQLPECICSQVQIEWNIAIEQVGYHIENTAEQSQHAQDETLNCDHEFGLGNTD